MDPSSKTPAKKKTSSKKKRKSKTTDPFDPSFFVENVQEMYQGKDRMEHRYRKSPERTPAAFQNKSLVTARDWQATRPLDSPQHAAPIVSFPESWESKHGRHASLRRSHSAVQWFLLKNRKP